MPNNLSDAVGADVDALAWKMAHEYRKTLNLPQDVYEALAVALAESLRESVGTVSEIYRILLNGITPDQLREVWKLADHLTRFRR